MPAGCHILTVIPILACDLSPSEFSFLQSTSELDLKPFHHSWKLILEPRI